MAGYRHRDATRRAKATGQPISPRPRQRLLRAQRSRVYAQAQLDAAASPGERVVVAARYVRATAKRANPDITREVAEALVPVLMDGAARLDALTERGSP